MNQEELGEVADPPEPEVEDPAELREEAEGSVVLREHMVV